MHENGLQGTLKIRQEFRKLMQIPSNVTYGYKKKFSLSKEIEISVWSESLLPIFSLHLEAE